MASEGRIYFSAGLIRTSVPLVLTSVDDKYARARAHGPLDLYVNRHVAAARVLFVTGGGC